MNDLTDHILAQRMLEIRDRGYRLSMFYRRSWKRYLFLSIYLAIALLVLWSLELWFVLFLVLGLVTGIVLSDISWVLAIRKSWPFHVRVTNWDKVREIAEEKEPV